MAAPDAVILAETPEAQRPLAEAMRDRVREVLPDATEAVKWGALTWIAPGKRNVTALGIYDDHINLVLHEGALLLNPHGLIEGTGKRLRHIKCWTVEDVARPGLREALEAAWARATEGEH